MQSSGSSNNVVVGFLYSITSTPTLTLLQSKGLQKQDNYVKNLNLHMQKN